FVGVKKFCTKKPVMKQENVLVDICPADKDKYRFGFNGQEKVNEWAGMGNFMDYKERGQDTRTGRFLSVDALSDKFPWYSPYHFAGNNPILFIDLDGTEPAKGSPNYGKNIMVGVINHKSLKNSFLQDPNTEAPYARNNDNWITSPVAVDFAQSATFLKAFQKKANNLVLGAHGGHKDGISVIGYTAFDASHNFITADDIYKYKGDAKSTLSDAKLKAIDDLTTILGAVKDGGNLILNACFINKDGGKLGKAIQSLANYKINVYLSTDYMQGGYESNGTRSNLDLRVIKEKGVVYSKDKNKNIVYDKSDYENGIYKIATGEASQPEKLDRNMIYNSQGTPTSVVPPKTQ
ncbi:hypothetical protein, partial [Taibaiella helva]|uniref:hypothetical protein n=1 Tax=Taibaiella helva TaxID=2301235 RepID=UPI001E3091EC